MSGRILDLLYPPVCPFCEEILPFRRGEKPGWQRDQICPDCRKKLPVAGEPHCLRCGRPVKTKEQEYCRACTQNAYAYDEGRSLWLHAGMVPQAIYRLKYHNKRYYARIFADEMAERYGRWIREKKIDEIIAIPLHRVRRRKRGFNQAELLAKELSRRLQIPVARNVVFRVRNTKPQKKLGPRERQRNLQSAFGVSASWKAEKSVLLIDDIYTTGATIHSVAKLLKRAGCQKVYFLTISIGQGI